MLEAKIIELLDSRYADGTSTKWGFDDTVITELAKDGWRLTIVFEIPGRPVPLAVFYRKVQDPAPTPKVEPKKKVGRPKKEDA